MNIELPDYGKYLIDSRTGTTSYDFLTGVFFFFPLVVTFDGLRLPLSLIRFSSLFHLYFLLLYPPPPFLVSYPYEYM